MSARSDAVERAGGALINLTIDIEVIILCTLIIKEIRQVFKSITTDAAIDRLSPLLAINRLNQTVD